MQSTRAFLYRLVFIANKAFFLPLCDILTYYETGDKADPQQAENNFNRGDNRRPGHRQGPESSAVI